MTNLFFDKIRSKFKIDKEFFSKSVLAFVLKIAGILCTYIFSYLITKNYGASGWGIFSLCLTISVLGTLIGKVGFDTALLKFTADFESEGSRGKVKGVFIQGMKLILPICIVTSIFLLTSAEFVSKHFFKKPYLSPFLFWTIITIVPTVSYLIISEGLRGLRRIKEYVFIQNVGVYFFSSLFTFIYFLLDKKADIYTPFKIYALSTFLILGISLFWWNNELRNFSPINSLKLTRLINVSLPLFLSNGMFVIINWTDTLVLGAFWTEKEVGIYNIAVKIGNAVAIPLLAINSIAAPKINYFYNKGEVDKLQTFVSNATIITFASSLLIGVILTVFPKTILTFFGKEFMSGEFALLIIVIGNIFNSFCGCTDILLQMTNNEKIFQKIIIIAMLLNVILNFVMIPTLGMNGAALANCLTIVAWNVLSIFYIKKKLNIHSHFLYFLKKQRLK